MVAGLILDVLELAREGISSPAKQLGCFLLAITRGLQCRLDHGGFHFIQQPGSSLFMASPHLSLQHGLPVIRRLLR